MYGVPMAEAQQDRLQLGGMALRNGLMLHGPTHWSAAIRLEDGQIKVASGRHRRLSGRGAVPILRGATRLAATMLTLPQMRRALPEARLAFETPTIVLTVLAGAALSGGARRARLSPGTVEALSQVLALLPALATLRSGAVARYHGAEHKTIAAYEGSATAVDAPKEHERCGSHLVVPMMATSLVGNLIASRTRDPRRAQATRAGTSVAAAGIAVEVFGWMTRHRAHPIARALRVPGTLLQQRLGTEEPTADELAVAAAALTALLRVERDGART